MKEKLLFVTKGGENCDEGFSYVLDLAKTLNTGVAVLMIYPSRMMNTFEDVMSAVAFAEAGELETVRELMQAQEKEMKEVADKKIGELTEKCRENSVELISKIAIGDTTTVIRDFLKDKTSIEMVLLSPNLSGNKKGIDLRKLIKNISKPIVTITKPVGAEV